MNAMLDGYPEEYKGYLIRTDYRIGIQICQCLADEEMNIYEKVAVAYELLFGRGIPDMNTAQEGLSWFINAGETSDQKDDEGDERYFDFEVDSGRIVTAFKKAYHIDLERENLHWFKFLSMLGDVGECAMTTVVNIRAKKITADMPAEQRATYAELKRKYSLVEYTEEEQDMIADFMELLNGNK